MNFKQFQKLDFNEYKEKYLLIGKNPLSDIVEDMYFDDYKILDDTEIPKREGFTDSGLLILGSQDVLGEDFSELDFGSFGSKVLIQIPAHLYDRRRKIFKNANDDDIIDTTADGNKDLLIGRIQQKLKVTKPSAIKLFEACSGVNDIFCRIDQFKYLEPAEVESIIDSLFVYEDYLIFNLIDAILTGKTEDGETPFDIYEKLEDEDFKLMYMLTKQVKNIMICKDFMINETNENISNKFGIHPYQVKIFKSQAGTFSMEEWEKIFLYLCTVEKDMKRGKITPKLALNWVIMYISNLRRF